MQVFGVPAGQAEFRHERAGAGGERPVGMVIARKSQGSCANLRLARNIIYSNARQTGHNVPVLDIGESCDTNFSSQDNLWCVPGAGDLLLRLGSGYYPNLSAFQLGTGQEKRSRLINYTTDWRSLLRSLPPLYGAQLRPGGPWLGWWDLR